MAQLILLHCYKCSKIDRQFTHQHLSFAFPFQALKCFPQALYKTDTWNESKLGLVANSICCVRSSLITQLKVKVWCSASARLFSTVSSQNTVWQCRKKKALLFFFFLKGAIRDGVRHRLLRTSPEHLKGFLGTANSEETLQTKNMLEGPHFPSDLRMSWDSLGGSGGNMITKERVRARDRNPCDTFSHKSEDKIKVAMRAD